ncbi:benzaldehyde dehydrogenase [Thauera aromatica]|uniref:Benzaldehyde dehydrogenase n=1 Tax=Thauera aromatica K172 TaxID=44139 RepID=A0A2R4BR47_THAAR|nr:benzaldehyde dehydrogenase [Thauera aromatica]AVR89821.1 Putative benzaldehyde dehydrogenase [Thauera aromatica K172]MCK2095916.1 benzaldehyde dehydrogenase [Thauera aromatica]
MSEDLLCSGVWQGKAWSSGWNALQGGILDVEEPATGQTIGRVSRANAADVRAACAAARSAQKAWVAMSYAARAAVFRKAAALLEANREAFAAWIVRETGGIPPKAMFEIDSVQHHLFEAAAMLTQPQGLVLPSEGGCTSITRRVPHGVVGVISPFNFPFLLSSRAVAPALAAGNAVVLKPDPRTPVSGGVLLAVLLEAAGLPAGVFHMLPGDAEAGEALVSDPAVAMISFTGSTAVGRRVGELAGRQLKKVALELGGKNVLIILDDADLELAVSGGSWASWLHQGQICMSAGRHLVHRDLAQVYAQRMAAKAAALPVGDPHTAPVAIGPLITGRQVERVDRIVQESVRMGAKLLAGGRCDGRFYHPTVLADVTPQMPAFREEIFGPVVSITAFGSDAEAVALAADNEYGLAAGIYTADVGRGMVIAEQLEVGLVHINDQTVNDNGLMPMGGRGASGNGSRHGGPANWDEFTQWQWLTVRNTAPTYPL